MYFVLRSIFRICTGLCMLLGHRLYHFLSVFWAISTSCNTSIIFPLCAIFWSIPTSMSCSTFVVFPLSRLLSSGVGSFCSCNTSCVLTALIVSELSVRWIFYFSFCELFSIAVVNRSWYSFMVTFKDLTSFLLIQLFLVLHPSFL